MRKKIRTEIYFPLHVNYSPLSTSIQRVPGGNLPNRALCLLIAASRRGLALWS